MLRNHHLFAFQQTEPGGPSSHQSLELLKSGRHHGAVLLGSYNARGQCVDHAQTPGAHLRIIQNDQQHAESEKQIDHQPRPRRETHIDRRPIQVQQKKAGAEQPRTDFPTSPTEPDHLDSHSQRNDAIGNLQDYTQGQRLRPIQGAQNRISHEGKRDYEQRQYQLATVRVDENSGGKQAYGQDELGLRD